MSFARLFTLILFSFFLQVQLVGDEGQTSVELNETLSAVEVQNLDAQAKQLISIASTLTKEHRDYLLYLFARLNRQDLAEALAVQVLKDNPKDKNSLLVMASMYVALENGRKAMKYARELVKYYLDDDQALYFLGAALFLQERYREANVVFRLLKVSLYDQKIYPYETDLASSAYNAGDWFRAAQAYIILLREHNLQDPLRQEIRNVLDTIYRTHLPQVEMTSRNIFLGAGSYDIRNIEYSRAVTDTHRFFTEAYRENVRIKESLTQNEIVHKRWEAILGLKTNRNQAWQNKSWIRLGEGSIGIGGEITRAISLDESLTIGIDFARPAEDSLNIRILNGREDKLYANITYKFPLDFTLNSQLFGKQTVMPSHNTLGYGYGADWRISKPLFKQNPFIQAVYRGQFNEFQYKTKDFTIVNDLFKDNIDSATRLSGLENLAAPRIHTHGLSFEYSDDMDEFIQYYFSPGIDYSFVRKGLDYGFNSDLYIWPRKSLRMGLGGGYNTSAQNGDAGSETQELRFSLLYYF